ncbi:MAG TPA: translation initiation factor IF-2 [bacterium]|nr:translation initiation factor IF-2 [bacterium]
MSKIRVFELAERAGCTPQELRDELLKHGKPVHSNLSLVEDPFIELMIAHFGGGKAPVAKPEPVAAAVASEALPAAPARPVEKIGVTIDMTIPSVPKFAIPKKKLKVVPKPEEAPAPPAPAAEAPAAVVADPADPAVAAPPAPKPAPRPEPRALTSVNFDIPKRERPKIVEVLAPERPSGIVRRDGSSVPSSAPAMGGPAARRPRPGDAPAAGATGAAAATAPAPGAAPAAGAAKPSGPPKPGVKGKPGKKDRREKQEQDFGLKPSETKITAPVKIDGALRPLLLPEGASISEMAQAMEVKASELIKKLMVDFKVMATVNQKLPKDVVETLAVDYGFEVVHEGLYGENLLKEENDDPARMVLRAPVVTIMGHVDHGKTTLLDAIRDAKVAMGEAGGITQHIGAYKVKLPEHEGFAGGEVVFLDTPGHAAFTAMRARGAKATDIVVLVVAADDGVMPQTVEAIDHAKAAGAPIVVAINKIDKEGANPDRVMQELGKHGLVPEEWGGATIMARLSAKKRQGVKELLELLALQAQVMELKADPGRRAEGVVIEGKLDKGRGAVATVLVQKGTLRVGDPVLVGNHVGRVRALVSDFGGKLQAAGPSTPVELLGLSGVPEAGDRVQAVDDEKLARQIATRRQAVAQDRDRANRGHVKLEDLFDRIQTGDVKELNIVIKADVSGSVEALRGAFADIKSDKVKARVIGGSVGAINESDVLLAAASDALVLGFHVKASPEAVDLAHREKVEIRLYDVIYDAVNDVRDAMTGLLEPHYNEVSIGTGEVLKIFRISKGFIAGSIVKSGKITRDCSLRFTRGGEKVWEGKPIGLKRFKDDAREVLETQECGISLDPSCDIKEGDLWEALIQQEVAQKL